ncbi:uncharacterized protein LOC117958144 [Etheostoma cragini]|uniref:uncharacterized protein LOC117958144 n=1 Tax=Etheostoma cragini TaxID=417921 RepID=UPI00155F39D5|nr:uncharacterized protein LOC117958144 [Etheostoma cragini]
MEDTCETPKQEEVKLVSSDSAHGSSAVDTDTEEGLTPTSNTFPYNEDPMHKTILEGDSGVGKTSLLVQFEQDKFLAGSFTATVRIGFTVSPHFLSSTHPPWHVFYPSSSSPLNPTVTVEHLSSSLLSSRTLSMTADESNIGPPAVIGDNDAEKGFRLLVITAFLTGGCRRRSAA